ncbi:MAG: phosphatase PAP2 family protein [Bacteroidota bacterium]|jgi:hypothetical protein|nr:phosphatase PAP2 family protein [Bacteroidota bacterium]
MKAIISNWKHACQNSYFRNVLLITLLLFIILVWVYPYFFEFIEHRQGFKLQDPIVNFLQPRDNSSLIFSLLWFSIGMQIWILKDKPQQALLFIMSYFIINLTRIITIYAVPLNPPTHLIPLQDPLSNYFYGTSFITKDLFYSGHTAIVLLIGFTSVNKWLKFIFIMLAIAIAFMVLSNHVHYTIDVLAAPFFVAFSIVVSKKIVYKLGLH